jgi:hypothetical protein
LGCGEASLGQKRSRIAFRNAGNAGPYGISSFELFQRFLAPQNKNNSINQDNVNLHAGFPPNPRLSCDLSKPLGSQKACIQEVYDLRICVGWTRLSAGMAIRRAGRVRVRHFHGTKDDILPTGQHLGLAVVDAAVSSNTSLS